MNKTIGSCTGSEKDGICDVTMNISQMAHFVFAVLHLNLQALFYFNQRFPNFLEAFDYFEVLYGICSVFF